MEDYKKNPLQTIDVPDSIINEERAYAAALAEIYVQELGDVSFTIERISEHEVQAKHLAEQRRYYFAAEAVRRGTRDIYKQEDQFDVLKEEIHEGVKTGRSDTAAEMLALSRYRLAWTSTEKRSLSFSCE